MRCTPATGLLVERLLEHSHDLAQPCLSRDSDIVGRSESNNVHHRLSQISHGITGYVYQMDGRQLFL